MLKQINKKISQEELKILSEYICIGCDEALDTIINGCGFFPRPCSKNSRIIKVLNCLEEHKTSDNDNSKKRDY